MDDSTDDSNQDRPGCHRREHAPSPQRKGSFGHYGSEAPGRRRPSDGIPVGVGQKPALRREPHRPKYSPGHAY